MDRRKFLTGGLAVAGATAGALVGREIGEPEPLTLRWVDVDSEEYLMNRAAIAAWATRAEVTAQLGDDSIRAAQVRSDREVVQVQLYVRRGGTIQVEGRGDRARPRTEMRRFAPGELPQWPVDDWPA